MDWQNEGFWLSPRSKLLAMHEAGQEVATTSSMGLSDGMFILFFLAGPAVSERGG